MSSKILATHSTKEKIAFCRPGVQHIGKTPLQNRRSKLFRSNPPTPSQESLAHPNQLVSLFKISLNWD
jgi:hypothetical protein